MGKDYYAILGVRKDATASQLRQAYRKLAMIWHPDKHQQKSPAEQEKAANMFKDIAEAYDVLSDDQKRKIYDLSGEDGLKGGGMGGDGGRPRYTSGVSFGQGGPGGIRYETHYRGVDPGELFSQFFGGGSSIFFDDDMGPFSDFTQVHQQSPSQKKVEDHEINLNVTLEELYKGTTKKMKVNRLRWRNGTRYYEDKILVVEVKKGWKDGTKITFKGEGQQTVANQQPGNIVFVIHTNPHPRFVRNGDHLVFKAQIDLKDCFRDVEVVIPTLDDRRLKIKAKPVISPKTRRVIANEGMPSQKTGEKGDLIVEFSIQFPTTLSPAKLEKIIAALE